MTLRLAIVGGGPRGLFALESLLHAGLDLSGALEGLSIDVFEDHPVPGSGPNYDPRLPELLRMNFAARHVDLWSPAARDAGRAGPTLVESLRASDDPGRRAADPDDFVPRAWVGESLADGWRRVTAGLEAEGVSVRVVASRVTAVEPDDHGWVVSAGDGRAFHADEVLLATGHDSSRRDDFAAEVGSRVERFVDASGPFERLLDPDVIPPGSVVAARGFALTWIDATLLLLEGRAAGSEVATVVPWSRSGRPLLAKPDPRRVRAATDLEPAWAAGRGRLEDVGPLAVDELTELLVDAAARALARSGDVATVDAHRAVDAELQGRLRDSDAVDAAVEMRRSVDVALGRRPVDARWALGEAWRVLYPALVERASHGGVPSGEESAFRRLGREMERLAFGPPASSVETMLRHVDAGGIDLRFVTDPTVDIVEGRLRLRAGDASITADVLLDTVRAAPGCDARSPLVGPLLASGHARLQQGTQGVETTRDGQAIGRDGQPTPGLSIVGRAVEGCVLGHDTLSRSLHPHLPCWAARVVDRALQAEGTTDDIRRAS